MMRLRRIPQIFVIGWLGLNLSMLLPLGYAGDAISLLFLIFGLGMPLIHAFGLTHRSDASIGRIEQALLAVGLGLMNIIVIGLIIDLVPSPDHDGFVRLPYLTAAFNAEATILGALYYAGIIKRPVSVRRKLNPVLKKRDSIAISLATVVLLTAIFGAIALNNQSSSLLAITSTILSAVTIVYMITRPGSNLSTAVSIYMIAASYLLAGWLRSNFISAVDTNMEFYMFSTVYEFGKWLPSLFPGHAYNACLSITLLPTVLQNFVNFDLVYMFKIVFPLLFALVAPAVYVSARNVLNKRMSIIAAALYIAQPAFMMYISIPARQQIAMLFFALLTMTALSKLSYRQKRILAVILFIGILLSHYTTAYIACLIIATAYIVEKLLLRRHGRKKQSSTKPTFSLFVIAIMLVSTAVWYSSITSSSSVATSFISKNLTNLNLIFDPSTHSSKASILNQFNPFYRQPDPQIKMDEYYKELQKTHDTTGSSAPAIAAATTIPSKVGTVFGQLFSAFKGLVQVFCKLLIIIGAGYLAYQYFRLKLTAYRHNATLNLAALISLGLLLLLPFLSETYDASRTYQQVLVVLAIAMSAGISVVCRMSQRWILIVSTAIILALIGFGNGLINQLIGGGTPSMNYNNSGLLYNRVYVDAGEMSSARWLGQQPTKTAILGDRMSAARITMTQQYGREVPVRQAVFDETITQDRYIYLRRQNLDGVGTINIKGMQYDYDFPNTQIGQQKNQIYSNQSSTIYK